MTKAPPGRLHPSSSGDWQVKDHEREWDEVSVIIIISFPHLCRALIVVNFQQVAVDQGGLWRKAEVEVTSVVEEEKQERNQNKAIIKCYPQINNIVKPFLASLFPLGTNHNTIQNHRFQILARNDFQIPHVSAIWEIVSVRATYNLRERLMVTFIS